jgi:hypothetical protein
VQELAPELVWNAKDQAWEEAAPDTKAKPTRRTEAPRRTKTKGTAPRRACLPQAAREWLARLRREGEAGLLTITQNIAEALAALERQRPHGMATA